MKKAKRFLRAQLGVEGAFYFMDFAEDCGWRGGGLAGSICEETLADLINFYFPCSDPAH